MKNVRRLVLSLLTVTLGMSLFMGCSEKTTTMEDREGNEFNIPSSVKTIVSTAPSNTEILMALGLSENLVAIDAYSTDIEGVNLEIPQIDFTNPDAETLISLKPDIIIASGHNREGAEDPFALLKEAGIPVAYIPSSSSIEEIYEDIEFIAELTGTEKEGKEIVDSMKADIEEIKTIADTIEDEKDVYFEIGAYGSLYTFGDETFMNEMIEVVGAKNIFADQSSWITVTPEAVIDANPEVILVNTPGTNAEGKTAIEDVMTRAGFETIDAVKNEDVYMIDGNASSRGSQNIIKALKEIAKALYPDEYNGL